MKRTLLLALTFLVLVGAYFASAGAQEPPSLEGTYLLAGTDPTGETYTGFVTITERGGVLDFTWTIEGGVEGIGIGIRTDAVVSVMYTLNTGGLGLIAFRVDGETLNGRWTGPGADTTWTETLTKTVLTPAVLRGAGPKRAV